MILFDFFAKLIFGLYIFKVYFYSKTKIIFPSTQINTDSLYKKTIILFTVLPLVLCWYDDDEGQSVF